jgi:hypothetical protein
VHIGRALAQFPLETVPPPHTAALEAGVVSLISATVADAVALAREEAQVGITSLIIYMHSASIQFAMILDGNFVHQSNSAIFIFFFFLHVYLIVQIATLRREIYQLRRAKQEAAARRAEMERKAAEAEKEPATTPASDPLPRQRPKREISSASLTLSETSEPSRREPGAAAAGGSSASAQREREVPDLGAPPGASTSRERQPAATVSSPTVPRKGVGAEGGPRLPTLPVISASELLLARPVASADATGAAARAPSSTEATSSPVASGGQGERGEALPAAKADDAPPPLESYVSSEGENETASSSSAIP